MDLLRYPFVIATFQELLEGFGVALFVLNSHVVPRSGDKVTDLLECLLVHFPVLVRLTVVVP